MVNAIGSSTGSNLFLAYTPTTTTTGTSTSTDSNTRYFEIGDNENQISLALIANLQSYLKNKNSNSNSNSSSTDSGSSFSDCLSESLYNNLSDTEKEFLSIADTDSSGLANSQVVTEDESTTDYSLLSGLPTEDYLKQLQQLETKDLKQKELIKYHKKMDDISGNTPLDELRLNVSGTNTRLSNFTSSDLERLNNMKIESVHF